jgi:hypothetical protein
VISYFDLTQAVKVGIIAPPPLSPPPQPARKGCAGRYGGRQRPAGRPPIYSARWMYLVLFPGSQFWSTMGSFSMTGLLFGANPEQRAVRPGARARGGPAGDFLSGLGSRVSRVCRVSAYLYIVYTAYYASSRYRIYRVSRLLEVVRPACAVVLIRKRVLVFVAV